MKQSILDQKHFYNEKAAFAYVESIISIFKRGMKGVYQHCKSNHLKRYLCEFDFRYNTKEITDSERAEAVLAGVMGKRLTYRISSMA